MSYDADAAERRWRERWAEETDPPEDPDFVVDTPPPYPTGELHIGHALGWTYMDVEARYRRLCGLDVLFPQGWDCHGLPTEVHVEETHDLDRTEADRERFRALCVEATEERVAAMRETMRELGFSQDWGAEFRTMDPAYRATTQLSFLRMARDDRVYRDDHPVNWCPGCETAIADAEVETETDVPGRLSTLEFPAADGGEGVAVATTRPELLHACVAVFVHPDDDRAARAGDRLSVPLYGHEVPLRTDEDVDPGFGTGAVMVCTFGDERDADWWASHDLPLRPALDDAGRLTDLAGEFAGLPVDEAGEAVRAALDDAGRLGGTERVSREVGVCWRCDTPVEVRSTEQWFVRVDGEAILDRAREVEWTPEGAFDRLREWTEGMAWDWVVSRQRDFATPIPAWHCGACDRTRLADESDLPVDPTAADPGEPCDCGARAWRGETDVLDTWMDSSVTPLWLRNWPEEPFDPVDLRPQGHDIVRTWAFYTLLRVDALADERPWDRALVNGMVFGEDGRKMSKSRGNSVSPRATVEDHSADALRQALVLGGRPGQDVQFDPGEVEAGSRFVTKLWNVTAFARAALDGTEGSLPPAPDGPGLRDADAWLLARLGATRDEATRHLEAERYDEALRSLRGFVRGDLADDYLELAKGRLYDADAAGHAAARRTLATAVRWSLTMLAPFVPFVTAEAWDRLPGADGTVHGASWPAADLPDPAEPRASRGATVAAVARTVRRYKSDRGVALNAGLPGVTVHADAAVDDADLARATNAPVTVRTDEPSVERVATGVDVDYGVLGPRFRDDAERVAAALRDRDPAAVADLLAAGKEVPVTLDGDRVTVPADAVRVDRERRRDGERVTVLDAGRATVVVEGPAE